MAISWCPGDIDILEAIAGRADPRKVLIHFSNWRTDAYDENYPTYIPSDTARKFIARAHQLGFHVMPHCNTIETDPNNPVYIALRDFGYRISKPRSCRGGAGSTAAPSVFPNPTPAASNFATKR